MFTLKTIDGVLLSQDETIPKAIKAMQDLVPKNTKKVLVFQNDVHICDYYLKGKQ